VPKCRANTNVARNHIDEKRLYRVALWCYDTSKGDEWAGLVDAD